MSLVWINGTLIDKAEARVSPFDHGFLYGDGVWEHFRVFGGKLFRPDIPLKQLFEEAARLLKLTIPYSQQQFRAAIEATIAANNRTEGYVRVIVTRGPGTLGPDPRKIDPQVFIIAEEYQPFPIELYKHGLHATVFGGYDPTNPTHFGRLLGPLYLVWAKQQALSVGCLEAIIFWRDQVIRGIEGNLFLVQNNKVRLILGGGGYDVMLDVVPELAKGAGIAVEEDGAELFHPITGADLLASDEVLLAGTTCGVIAIISMDHKQIGSGTEGPITRQIREAYRRLTRGAE